MNPLHADDALLAQLQCWVDAGWLRPLDLALARMLGEEADAAGAPAAPLLLLAVALTSHQVGRGHVCLDLARLRSDAGALLSLPPESAPVLAPPTETPAALLAGVGAADWAAALAHPLLVASGAGAAPLVLEAERLYLRRYWRYEHAIAGAVRERLALTPLPLRAGEGAAAILAQALEVLFPPLPPGQAGPDWQRIACALAARHAFAVITGGPGTGKTTTVVRLLAALQAVSSQVGDGRLLRVRLAAPTGKAAARLGESIVQAVGRLPLADLPGGEALAAGIPTRVTTLHRLLGSRPGQRGFRHHVGQPLPLDLLVVDEASMVDVEMMAALLDALPAQAHLVLLGDKDQLASVDAGAVLGELCQDAELGRYREDTAQWLRRVAGSDLPPACLDVGGGALDQAITMLRHSHRFDAGSGIGQLALAVNRGELDAAAAQPFRQGQWPDVAWHGLARERAAAQLAAWALDGAGRGGDSENKDKDKDAGLAHYLRVMRASAPQPDAGRPLWDAWARRVLEAFSGFQLLCALRAGELGVDALNREAAAALHRRGLIERDTGWYPGRPVLVTRNDYDLGLMNGDIGVTLAVPSPQEAGGQRLRVAFPAADGGVHWVAPGRLQSIDTVYAMTVHKSQGSEFRHACLALPGHLSPVLTRELIYTGITRARERFSLALVDEAVLYQAVRRRVQRSSGLGQRLRD